MPTRDEVIEVAKECYDPEIPVNIWDLGLIYDIESDQNQVHIRMTLTSQACPAAREIPETLKKKIEDKLKIKKVAVDVVYDPIWTPERISEEGKKKLGIEI